MLRNLNYVPAISGSLSINLSAVCCTSAFAWPDTRSAGICSPGPHRQKAHPGSFSFEDCSHHRKPLSVNTRMCSGSSSDTTLCLMAFSIASATPAAPPGFCTPSTSNCISSFSPKRIFCRSTDKIAGTSFPAQRHNFHIACIQHVAIYFGGCLINFTALSAGHSYTRLVRAVRSC